MAVVIDVIKARLALLAVINAIGLVLAGLGKISSDTTKIWTEQAGQIFDYLVLIFGCLALLMPGILNFVKVKRPTHATLGVFLFCVIVLPLFAGCETIKSAAGQVCYTDANGTQVCIPIKQTPPPAPAQIQPLPPPILPALEK